MKGLIDEDGTIHMLQEDIDEKIFKYFEEILCSGHTINKGDTQESGGDVRMHEEVHMEQQVFSNGDIVEAMQECNFDKAMGCDGFDGRILSKSAEVKTKIASELCLAMNKGVLPSYFQ